MNFPELSWTFQELSLSHDSLQLQVGCTAMEHRCDASLVKSWNLNCSSFYDALLRRWVWSWALCFKKGVANVTTLRSIKPWQRKNWKTNMRTWTRCLKAKLQLDAKCGKLWQPDGTIVLQCVAAQRRLGRGLKRPSRWQEFFVSRELRCCSSQKSSGGEVKSETMSSC